MEDGLARVLTGVEDEAEFAAALGVGRVVGPIDVEPAAAAHDDSHDDSPASDQGDAASAEVADVGGLTSRADGFATAFPKPGTYRLFLDLQHRGVVHTAAFTVESGGAPGHLVEEGEGHEH